jgi:hypothetical protein
MTVCVLIGVVTFVIGSILGYWQGKSAQRTLDLIVTKAVPKIGTTIRIDKRQENPSNYPPFYYLIATIYNEGELPAQQLKGYCRVYSSEKSVREQSIPIARELLGTSSPCELELGRLESGISGMALNLGADDGENARFNVDIQFNYSGIQNTPQHYSANYEYDHKSRQIIKI